MLLIINLFPVRNKHVNIFVVQTTYVNNIFTFNYTIPFIDDLFYIFIKKKKNSLLLINYSMWYLL